MLEVLRAGSLCIVLVTACAAAPGPKARTLEQYKELCRDAGECTEQCDAGDARACDAAGLFFELGESTEQSYVRAGDLYERACERGSPNGCNHLGLFNEIGLGVRQNNETAVNLYQRACEGQLGDGCANLSRMYAEGSGVTKDAARAKELAAHACQLGTTSACGAP